MKQVIQIGGTVRSGTTLTGLLLANSKDGMALGEVVHLFYPKKQEHYKVLADLKKNRKWQDILLDSPSNLYENIFTHFPEVNIITDSSKDPFWFRKLEKNKSSQFDINQIVTYKSPSGLYQSFKKRNLNNWQKVYVNYYRRYFSLFKPALTVNIETLIRQKECLLAICNYFNIGYQFRRYNYWQFNHPNFFGSSTIRKNKIEPEKNDLVSEKVNISYSAKIIYDFLKNHEINLNESHYYVSFPQKLKYSKMHLFLLKQKDFIQNKIIK